MRFLSLSLLLLLAHPAWSATLTVTSNCTLADAIRAANQDQTVGGCPAGEGADTLVRG